MSAKPAAATDSSPAPLRLSLTPARGGINVGFVKRQGPARDELLFLPMGIGHVRPEQPQRDVVPDRAVYSAAQVAAMANA